MPVGPKLVKWSVSFVKIVVSFNSKKSVIEFMGSCLDHGTSPKNGKQSGFSFSHVSHGFIKQYEGIKSKYQAISVAIIQ